MSNLSIDYNNGINNVHPLCLDGKRIGDVTVNRDKKRDMLILFDVFIYEKYRGNRYFPKTIKFLENEAKNLGFKFFIAQWIEPSKIEFYLKKGFRELTDDEYQYFTIPKESNVNKEISLIKRLLKAKTEMPNQNNKF